MSISTLAENKVDRNASQSAPPASALPGQANPPPEDGKRSLSDALAAVATYVPTEIIAAYTIVLALGSDDRHSEAIPFSWFFAMLVFTPLFVWLVYAVRSKEQQRDFLSPRLWPWWESIAACISFTVWSAALPNSAFARCEWYSPRLAAIALLLISGLLPLVGALMTKSRPAT
jgi:hypothetical protein